MRDRAEVALDSALDFALIPFWIPLWIPTATLASQTSWQALAMRTAVSLRLAIGTVRTGLLYRPDGPTE